MSEHHDSNHSKGEINSGSDDDAAYWPLDSTRDYMSEYKRVSEKAQGMTLRIHGKTHTGVKGKNIEQWAEALEDDLDEGELHRASDAAAVLRQQIQDTRGSLAKIDKVGDATKKSTGAQASRRRKRHKRVATESSSSLDEADGDASGHSFSGDAVYRKAAKREFAKLRVEIRKLRKDQQSILQNSNTFPQQLQDILREVNVLRQAHEQLAGTTNEFIAQQNSSKGELIIQRNSSKDQLMTESNNTDLEVIEVSDPQVDKVSTYKSMFGRLFQNSEIREDFSRFPRIWSRVFEGLQTFKVEKTRPIRQVHGLTSTTCAKLPALKMALAMLLNMQLEKEITVADIYGLDYTLYGCDKHDRITVTAIIYAVVMEILDLEVFTFVSSMVLLRGIAMILSSISPDCHAISSLKDSFLRAEKKLYKSSILVTAMATVVIDRLNGSVTELFDALCKDSVLRKCQALKNGWIFIREAERGLTVIMPSGKIVFVPLNDISLEEYDIFTSTEPLASEGYGQCYRLAFHKDAFFGAYKTAWWSYDAAWAMLNMIADLLERRMIELGLSSANHQIN